MLLRYMDKRCWPIWFTEEHSCSNILTGESFFHSRKVTDGWQFYLKRWPGGQISTGLKFFTTPVILETANPATRRRPWEEKKNTRYRSDKEERGWEKQLRQRRRKKVKAKVFGLELWSTEWDGRTEVEGELRHAECSTLLWWVPKEEACCGPRVLHTPPIAASAP